MSQQDGDAMAEYQEEVAGNNNLPPPPGADPEMGKVRPESNFRGVSGVEQWKEEDWMKNGLLVLILRAVTLLFSFLAFMLMVTLYFSLYAAYSYVVAISVFVMVYTAVLVGIRGHEIITGQEVFVLNTGIWIEFIGDQVMALLLLSSASAGAGLLPYGQTGASVSMAFLAFFPLQAAALISGYRFALHFSKSI